MSQLLRRPSQVKLQQSKSSGTPPRFAGLQTNVAGKEAPVTGNGDHSSNCHPIDPVEPAAFFAADFRANDGLHLEDDIGGISFSAKDSSSAVAQDYKNPTNFVLAKRNGQYGGTVCGRI